MKSIRTISFFIGAIFILTSCDFINKATSSQEDVENKLLAVVGDESLYYSDIVDQFPANFSISDSADVVYRIVDSWIKTQLLVEEAREADIDFDLIDRKINNVKKELIIYELQKEVLLKDSLDLEVSDDEIVDYYEAHQEEFELKQNIFQGLFAVVPKSVSSVRQLRRLMKKADYASQEEVKEYCLQNAEKYFLEDSVWIALDNIVAGTPFMNLQNQESFLRYNKFSEMSDTSNYYFITIYDYKIKGETSPLNFHEDRIKNILWLRKKKQKLKEFEQGIYKKALEGEEFEIYN